MARIMEPTPEQEQGYREWVASRPPNVRAIAERFEPWSLYRLKSSGHRISILAFDEHVDGTVTLTVCVSGAFNLVAFARSVFGIQPDDLEPCELPSADELTGSLMTPEDVDENLDALRVIARPDLWEMDADGHAIRKVTH